MELFFRRMGQGVPVVILHGLYGSSDNWLTIARGLSGQYEVFVPDLRNHGRSPHHPLHTYAALSADIIELMDNNNIDRCIMLGHSMGGKTAMYVAATIPQRIIKLIIDDIAPVNYSSASEFSPLSIEHLNIVDTLLHTDLNQYTKREEIEQSWAQSIPDMNVRQFLLKNLRRENGTHYSWRINIQAIVQNLPHILNGMDQLELDKGKHINVPTLFVKGKRSPYISPAIYPFIRQSFTNSQIVTIPNAGHWLHVEQPELFLDVVQRFLLSR